MTMLIEFAFLKVVCRAGRLADELSRASEVYTERLLGEADGFADVGRMLGGAKFLAKVLSFGKGKPYR
jgi:hypothetical protein